MGSLLDRLRTTRLLFVSVLVFAACSSGQNAQHPSATATAALKNPLDFPLYPDAALISTHSFTQVINAQGSGANKTVFESGNGTYDGHEVIAASSAAFTDLSSWVDKVDNSPPPGYIALEPGTNLAEHEQAERYGIDYATFKKKEGNRTHGVLIIVMDPELVNQRFGRLLGMIAKYRALPDVLRAPADSAAKARFGMTISEATQPDSPVGAALSALDEFEHRNARGIVVLDATKR